MENLIDEATDRGVQPYDLFEHADALVDSDNFFKNIVAGTDSNYQSSPERRILKNSEANLFYQVLLSYLDSLGTGKKNYTKLEPAAVKIDRWSGKYLPIDGRHRAKFCSMLGIKLPVNILGERKEPEGYGLYEETSTSDIFDTNHINIPFYNELLKSQAARKRENRNVKIVQMSPREYFNGCAEVFDSTFDKQIRQIREDTDTLEYIQSEIDKGHKLPLTWLDYGAERSQDGRHRMYVVGNAFGWDEKYPVAIFTTADEQEAERRKRAKEEERITKYFYWIENKLLGYAYRDLDELKEEVEYLISDYLNDKPVVEVEQQGKQLLITVNGVDFTYNMNDFDWEEEEKSIFDDDETFELNGFDYDDLEESLNENVDETGDTVIKAVIYSWEEPPKKPVADFEDFEEDGVYRLGDRDYIAFEKRWRDNPRGWGLIHQDIIDNFVKPLYDHYDQWNRYVGIEVDNLGPRIFMYDDVQDNKLGRFAKYGPIIRKAIRNYFE